MNNINELRNSKADLCLRKQEIQIELSDLNSQVRGKKIAPSKYAAIVQKQEDLKQELAGIEKQILGIGHEIHTLVQVDMKRKDDKPTGIIPTLVGLRDYYEKFAADPTRVSSMRRMAAEFAMKLTAIIKTL